MVYHLGSSVAVLVRGVKASTQLISCRSRRGATHPIHTFTTMATLITTWLVRVLVVMENYTCDF